MCAAQLAISLPQPTAATPTIQPARAYFEGGMRGKGYMQVRHWICRDMIVLKEDKHLVIVNARLRK